jgi:hypothetical protein
LTLESGGINTLWDFLGHGVSRNTIILSALLVVILFFYIYSLSSYLKLVVWVLVDRVTYFSPFEGYVITKYVDHLVITAATVSWIAISFKFRNGLVVAAIYGIIGATGSILSSDTILQMTALISVPVITVFAILNRLSHKVPNSERNLIVNYFIVIGIITGIVAIITPFYLVTDSQISLRNYAYEIYALFSSFSPALLVLLILSFPIKIIINSIAKTASIAKSSNLNRTLLKKESIEPIKKLLLLLGFMSLSVALVAIPHLKVINFDGSDVGVDTHYYSEWTNMLLNSTSTGEFLDRAFVLIQHGDRPFTLFFFVSIAKLIPSDNLSYLFDYSPVVFAPTLVLVFYFLTRELTSNDFAAILSAFLTAVSFHTLIGIYAGSYANWLALIVGNISIIFLLRSLKKSDKLNTAMFFILLIVTLFTHLYTWTIMTIALGIFLLALLKTNAYPRRNVILLLLILSSSVLFDLARMSITGSFSGIGYGISPPFGELRFGPEQFATRWSSLIDTTQNYYGSLFGNFIIYVLGIYWLIRCKLREASTIFLISILSIGIIPLFFGNWIVQSRVFYDIPFQIPASIALAYIYRKGNRIITLIPILLWLAAISITAVFNFHLVMPS